MPTYNNGAGYFLYINDISEVYGYNVPAGGNMFFMDKNKPILYLKSVNMFNQQNVTKYNLVEEPAMPQPEPTNSVPQPFAQQNTNNYITRDELTSVIADTIRNELRNNRGYNKNNRKEE